MAWDIGWGFHNLLTCSGWDTANAANMGMVSVDLGGPCMMAKLGLVILFFIIAIVRKWGGEEIGVSFSMLWASILGLGLYLLSVTLTGSFKLSILIGLVGMAVGGYVLGMFMEGESGGSSYE